jgi:hypothetical protein
VILSPASVVTTQVFQHFGLTVSLEFISKRWKLNCACHDRDRFKNRSLKLEADSAGDRSIFDVL